MNKIYVAGPISGMSYDEVQKYFKTTSHKLEQLGYDVLTPMIGKSALRTELKLRTKDYTYPISTNHAIFGRDQWMVRQSDIILCNLENSGERVSIGSMMELAWASMLGKHIIVVLPKNNIHQHAFVLEAADIIYETYDEALEYLENLIKKNTR